jgi:hypothetical protein
MLLGLAANLWATSETVLEKSKEVGKPGNNECGINRVQK